MVRCGSVAIALRVSHTARGSLYVGRGPAPGPSSRLGSLEAGPGRSRLRRGLVDELDEGLVGYGLGAGAQVAVPAVRTEGPAVGRAEQVRDAGHGHADASDD